MPVHFLFAASVILSTLAARLPPITIPAQTSSITIDVHLAKSRQKLLAATNDPFRDVVLDLDGIEAPRSPAVYFEVYIHARSAPRAHTAGNIALYGTGIRSEPRFRPAHIQMVITDDLREALRKAPSIAITFVAQGAGGSPAAKSASVVTIGKVSIVIVPRARE